MRFGVHVGIGKGFRKTIDEALAAGCESIQIFAGNPRAFRRTAYDAAAWNEFRRLRKENGIAPTVIHTSYLVNLVTAKTELHDLSTALVAHDLELAAKAGIEYVNTHLGSYGDQDRKAGFKRVCATLKALIARAAPGPMLLLENSAGAGNACGGKLEELGAILKEVGSPRVGVCLDTAHAWASGYEISSPGGIDAFLREVKKHIGFRRVRAMHMNDTKVELGTKRDLHWHVGQGKIGNTGFRSLLAAPGLAHVAGICETPKTPELDALNVATLRRLAGSGTKPQREKRQTELSRAKSGRKRV
jgi:deoxyribonuclease IV